MSEWYKNDGYIFRHHTNPKHLTKSHIEQPRREAIPVLKSSNKVWDLQDKHKQVLEGNSIADLPGKYIFVFKGHFHAQKDH